jgi:hypothetical protein
MDLPDVPADSDLWFKSAGLPSFGDTQRPTPRLQARWRRSPRPASAYATPPRMEQGRGCLREAAAG